MIPLCDRCAYVDVIRILNHKGITRSPGRREKMIALRFYRIYDIGREIDLDWLERSLAQTYFTARTSFCG